MGAVSVVLIGAGQRGRFVYGAHAARHPEDLTVAAVVEPDARRCAILGDEHAIPKSRWFARPEEALDVPCDAWIVASPDRHHAVPAAAALARGRHVLLEKPMGSSPSEVTGLAAAASASAGFLVVAHVLRYTPFFLAVHEVVSSGRLGDVVTVEHRENVASWHMAHSFVRGNWARREVATPMIVQKCCHDFDVLVWNLQGRVSRLSSFGSLRHFRPEEAPEGSTARCTDPCPVVDCPFDARALYLEPANRGWPVHVITHDLSRAGRLEALRLGPYGRCVYTAGSDVVDHQVVAMELEDGTSVTLTMHGHSHEEGRTMRYDGTRATMRARFGARQEIEVVDHSGGGVERVPITPSAGGHGGGDEGLIGAFVDAVRGEEPPPTTAAESLESHLLAFAAEEARLTGQVVDMDEYRRFHDRASGR